jgi:hypothetical protein
VTERVLRCTICDAPAVLVRGIVVLAMGEVACEEHSGHDGPLICGFTFRADSRDDRFEAIDVGDRWKYMDAPRAQWRSR